MWTAPLFAVDDLVWLVAHVQHKYPPALAWTVRRVYRGTDGRYRYDLVGKYGTPLPGVHEHRIEAVPTGWPA